MVVSGGLVAPLGNRQDEGEEQVEQHISKAAGPIVSLLSLFQIMVPCKISFEKIMLLKETINYQAINTTIRTVN